MNIAKALSELTPDASWTCNAEDYNQLTWLSPDILRPTREQVYAKIEELKAAEPMRLLRIERDRLLAETDWVITMHKEKGTNIPAAWKTYRQALRDLPDNSTPVLDSTTRLGISGVTWPTKP